MAEALGALLSKTKDIGLISDFEVAGEVEAVTHLQFENDTILFTSTRREEITNLERILRCCQIALGLKINLSKSFLVDVGSFEKIMHCHLDYIAKGADSFSIFGEANWDES